MRPSVTKKDYAVITEQFIGAIGLLAVQQSLGENISKRIESIALGGPLFQRAMQKVSTIISVSRENSGENGVSYKIKVPKFTPDMTTVEEEGFRAVFANVLARSLKLNVTEFSPDPMDKLAFDVRLCDIEQQTLLDRMLQLKRDSSVSL